MNRLPRPILTLLVAVIFFCSSLPYTFAAPAEVSDNDMDMSAFASALLHILSPLLTLGLLAWLGSLWCRLSKLQPKNVPCLQKGAIFLTSPTTVSK